MAVCSSVSEHFMRITPYALVRRDPFPLARDDTAKHKKMQAVGYLSLLACFTIPSLLEYASLAHHNTPLGAGSVPPCQHRFWSLSRVPHKVCLFATLDELKVLLTLRRA